jgi:hypothetical protein
MFDDRLAKTRFMYKCSVRKESNALECQLVTSPPLLPFFLPKSRSHLLIIISSSTKKLKSTKKYK